VYNMQSIWEKMQPISALQKVYENGKSVRRIGESHDKGYWLRQHCIYPSPTAPRFSSQFDNRGRVNADR